MRMKKVLFIGSKQLGLESLQTMARLSPETLTGVLTFDDSIDDRSALPDFRSFCNEQNVPLHLAQNRKHSEELIKSIAPDLCIVVGWYWLIGKTTLDAVPEGFLGIHASLLPKYRGGSPLVWSIINGEPQIGFSMFSFTEGMDEGDIWIQYAFDLTDEMGIGNALEHIERQVITELDKNYLSILDGSLKPVPQEHDQATYCAGRKAEDGKIDWKRPAREVFNFIRAQSKPYPGAFTYFNDQPLIIWEAAPIDGTYYGTPGQVAMVSANGVIVICGDNRALEISSVHFNGEDTKANSVIKSIKIRL